MTARLLNCTSAPAAWVDDTATTDVNEADGVVKLNFAKATKSGETVTPVTKNITLDATSAATVTENLAWTDQDTCTLSMAFKFDVKANTGS